MKTTRERQLRFIAGSGRDALRRAVGEMFAARGADWLTDEQVRDIVEHEIAEWRRTQRLNRRNREIARRREVSHA